MIAVFPGSFDPLTNGHLDLIVRAAKMYDKIIVAVMTNTSKRPLFSTDEKVKLIEANIAPIKNAEVVAVESDLTVNVMHRFNAAVLVRGVRDVKDFEYEREIAAMNDRLDPEIETVLLLAKPENSFLSSSMLKEVAQFHGDIRGMVPANVATALQKKWQK
ncbi:phosphopantetheine adenylyltransferase [Ligilactobacillus salitolerans]|uniref:Phosphopantetheine adenylyltransferase n=1 Tax=Ligilactobacillus salitolerans TaxID=1808352 RepID=A0A401IQZ0_9LACO|nr:pantetheine-phosphate adenylyltransferase [Ligilactobacillus salitolerans]GBG93914.1 phosphopantetheine adenylyltransferase [Ligilactobacillus salitolerans]